MHRIRTKCVIYAELQQYTQRTQSWLLTQSYANACVAAAAAAATAAAAVNAAVTAALFSDAKIRKRMRRCCSSSYTSAAATLLLSTISAQHRQKINPAAYIRFQGPLNWYHILSVFSRVNFNYYLKKDLKHL